MLEQSGFNPGSISHDLISREYNDLCYEFHGEITGDTDTTYEFPELESSRLEVAALRDKLHYDKHVIKNVAFSTDNDEQANIEEKEERAELDAFSKMLKTGVAVKKLRSSMPSRRHKFRRNCRLGGNRSTVVRLAVTMTATMA